MIHALATVFILAFTTAAFAQKPSPATLGTRPSTATQEANAPAMQEPASEPDERKFLGYGGLTYLGFAAVALFVFLLPWFIALSRHHNNSTPILLVCLFFGWSCIGYAVAMIWAHTSNVRVPGNDDDDEEDDEEDEDKEDERPKKGQTYFINEEWD